MMIGRRPRVAFGNSTGDQQMLEYTGAGDGARLMMLVLHDDADARVRVRARRRVARFESRHLHASAVRRSEETRLDRDQHEERLEAHLRLRALTWRNNEGVCSSAASSRRRSVWRPPRSGISARERARRARRLRPSLLWLTHDTLGAGRASRAIAARPPNGARRSITTRWRKRTRGRCSAISATRRSPMRARRARSSGTTGCSTCAPTDPTASSRTFEVKYTFGVYPLQQYLVEFPDGRLQALSIAWDARPKNDRRPALVSPLPERTRHARRRAALDASVTELELHVRGLSLDGRPQELRRGR